MLKCSLESHLKSEVSSINGRKTLCEVDTRWHCSPDYPTRKSRCSPERTGEIGESKTHADPLAFLLAALVSIELQLPRTPKPRGAPSATTSTKDCARHPDPKGSPKEWLSAAGSQLTLPATKDLYHMPTMGRHETNEVPSVSGLGNQVHSSVRKQTHY